jgi:hypothetical protein
VTTIQAAQAGLVGEQTASIALGYDEDEYEKARADHAARLVRIAASQGAKGDMGARGITDLSANPNAGEEEKAASRDTTLQGSTAPPVRGAGKPKLE